MRKVKSLLLLLALVSVFTVSAKKIERPSVEPEFWWAGMNETSLQLMVNGEGIVEAVPYINYPGVSVDSIVKADSPNYMFIYLNVSREAKPGKFDIVFKNGKKRVKYEYQLKERTKQTFKPFDASDLLYLIMPDRFADGDTTNNNIKGLNNPVIVDRKDPNGRHGGDLKGIQDHLDYIDELGVTAIWLTPVLENDMQGGSYHGYATTNYYKVDPRFGTNEDYKTLINAAHDKGIKVVMDMIFNHCGVDHKWLKDLPMKDWLNNPNCELLTNFSLSTVNDPYASDFDYDRTVNGWFVPVMPDLNQKNPHMMKYLIQNSIWWIEEAQIDGIRMDTYPYADMFAMADWLAAVEKEYPGYNIVGECWYGNAGGTAYWQKNSRINRDGETNLKTVMDFPTMIMSDDFFNGDTQQYNQGMRLLYDRLAQDYLYEDPQKVLVFLENHDSDRFLKKLPENLGSWKQAMTFLLTSRGIPQMYYGQELLMYGTKEGSDGYVRKDVKGGFPGDTVSEFTAEGRTELQNEAFDFFKKVANWRRGNDRIAKGKLKHFIPENGMYVYQRSYNGKDCVVIMNGCDNELTIDMRRYQEVLPEGSVRKDVITGNDVKVDAIMKFAPRAVMILE